MNNVIALRAADNGWDFDVPVREVTKVILAGLKSAGVKAEQGKVWRGKMPTMLDLVIDIECPAGHLSRDRMSFAKVQLLVDPHSGTLTVYRDEGMGNGCPHCDQQSIDRWLVTCRAHDEHPDHEPGWISVWDFPDDMPNEEIVRTMGGSGDEVVTDDSPMGHVFQAMTKAERENKARWRLAHLDQVADGFRESGWSEEDVQRMVADVREKAKALLSSGTERVGSGEVVLEDDSIRTVEAAVEWLNGLTDPPVPASLGVNAAWDLVKNLSGCPTQALVRKAQGKRTA